MSTINHLSPFSDAANAQALPLRVSTNNRARPTLASTVKRFIAPKR